MDDIVKSINKKDLEAHTESIIIDDKAVSKIH